MDYDPRAAASFYREVRKFVLTAKPWASGIREYHTKPDEIYDLSLVSRRVYGRRDEYLAVMAAAGIDSFDQPLTQRTIYLPTEAVLTKLKRKTGFESRAEFREKDAPIWLEE